MIKHKLILSFVACFPVFLGACQGSKQTPYVSVKDEPAGENCELGGQLIQVKQGNNVQNAYVCDGEGTLASVEIEDEAPGKNCEKGGVAITSRVGDGSPVTAYVCDGDAPALSATAEPRGKNCDAGGIKLITGDDVSYVCHGKIGESGDGVEVTPAGSQCEEGGAKLSVGDETPIYVCNGASTIKRGSVAPGADCAEGGIYLQVPPSTQSYFICNGVTGASGQDGAPGADGEDGEDGLDVVVLGEQNGGNCAEGGVSIQAPNGVAHYVCNGADGESVTMRNLAVGSTDCVLGGVEFQIGTAPATHACNGAEGAPGQSVVLSQVNTGSTECPYGGVSAQVATTPPTPIAYVCNGAPGATGAAGESVKLDTPTSQQCPQGGVSFQVGTGAVQYVCNGSSGPVGAAGRSVVLTTEPAGVNCSRGGVKMQVGTDAPSYTCNGGMTWSTITSATTASRNSGYVANSATAFTLTLPSTASLQVGDIVRLINKNTGGVTLGLNAGQDFVYPPGTFAFSTQFFDRTPPGSTVRKQRAALSGNGKTIAVVEMVSTTGVVFTSTNGGLTWTSGGIQGSWRDTAVSEDGSLVYAAEHNGIYRSTDGGATWNLLNDTPSTATYGTWIHFVASADGSKLAASTSHGSGSSIFVSSDFGTTWTQRTIDTTQRALMLALSGDGRTLMATDEVRSVSFLSRDFGVTWSSSLNQIQLYGNPQMSADGRRITASRVRDSARPNVVVRPGGPTSEGLATSTDGGVTWLFQALSTDQVTQASLASRADTMIVGYQGSGRENYFLSLDTGLTWIPGPSFSLAVPNTAPYAARSGISADGSKAVLTSSRHGKVYVNGTGSLVLPAFTSIGFLYTGNGKFSVTDTQGRIEAP